MKHKSRIWSHVGMKEWRVSYLETYVQGLNSISVRSLLSIASIHEFPSRSIEFLVAFPQSDFGVDIFVELPLGMGVSGNR